MVAEFWNSDIYILTKLNELAEQYGLHPAFLCARINESNQLEFPVDLADPRQEERRAALRKAIGCVERETDIGDAVDLIDRIDGALRKAHSRGRAR